MDGAQVYQPTIRHTRKTTHALPRLRTPPRDLPAYGGAFEVQSDEEREKVAKMMAEKRKSLPFMKKKEAENE